MNKLIILSELKEICERLGDLEDISIDDNVFGWDLDSLAVVALTTEISEKYQLILSINEITEMGNIRTLAQAIYQHSSGNSDESLLGDSVVI